MSVTYIRGVGVASAAAGPLFLLAMLVTSVPGAVVGSNEWPLAVVAVFASVPFGFALAAVPNLLGAALLATLGLGNDGTRLPVFWLLAGAGIGAALDAALAAAGVQPFAPLFTLVGAACALLCRWGTRWTDQETFP